MLGPVAACAQPWRVAFSTHTLVHYLTEKAIVPNSTQHGEHSRSPVLPSPPRQPRLEKAAQGGLAQGPIPLLSGARPVRKTFLSPALQSPPGRLDRDEVKIVAIPGVFK